jgi:hypothetical protein
LKKAIHGTTAPQKPCLLLFARSLGVLKLEVAPRDKVGRGCGIHLRRDRVGDSPASELEITKARDQICMRCREPDIQAVDRVDGFPRMIVPDVGRREGKCELIHGKLRSKQWGKESDVHNRSTATGLPLISALNRGERSSGRRQSSGFGALTAPGCGITIGQNW